MAQMSYEKLSSAMTLAIFGTIILIAAFVMSYMNLSMTSMPQLFGALPITLPPYMQQMLNAMMFIGMIISIIGGVLNVIGGILANILLRKYLEDLMVGDHYSNYRNAKRWFLFAPIASGAVIFLMPFLDTMLTLDLSSMNMAQLLAMMNLLMLMMPILLVFLVFAIFALIGSIYYGIYVFQLGDDNQMGIFKPAGILFIFFPGIGMLLLYIGLKKM